MRQTIIALCFLSVLYCTKPPQGLSYDQSTYKNDLVGIQINLPGDWELYTNKKDAPAPLKASFKKNKSLEIQSPLFVAYKKNTQCYIRCLLEKSDLNIDDYFASCYEINKNNLQTFTAKRTIDTTVIKWIYKVNLNNFDIKFDETILKERGYVIRLGFWTIAPLFTKYQEEFNQILNTTYIRADGKYTEVKPLFENRLQQENVQYVTIASETKALGDKCNERRPLLYKVEHNNNELYVFGSIHFGSSEFYPFPAIIDSAFKSSKNLIVEVNTISENFVPSSKKLLMGGLLEENKTLKTVLSTNTYSKVDEIFKQFGLQIEKFNKFKPWLLAVSLESLFIQAGGYVSEYGVDRHFLEKAKLDNKNILEVESLEKQIEMLKNLNEEDYLIYTMLKKDTKKEEMRLISESFLCGNESDLKEQLLKDYSYAINNYDSIYQKLIVNRNHTMADYIENYLIKNKEAGFMVIGMAHVIGNDGIIQILTKKGYKIEKM
jgi:uncharacterized protein YbaP (TraB family)